MINDNFNHQFQIELQRDEKATRFGFYIIGTLIVLILIDIIVLNVLILQNKSFFPQTMTHPATIALLSPTSLPTPSQMQTNPSIVPTQIIVIQKQSSAKEYFIPLGSGTNQTNDWEDVPGAQATVDFSKYPTIKAITFEASIYVPTANESVSVRLFNKTDLHPVWNSEVTMNGNASGYLTSSPLIFDTGEKIYQVQMKTQLQYLANLTQARIHIVLQ